MFARIFYEFNLFERIFLYVYQTKNYYIYLYNTFLCVFVYTHLSHNFILCVVYYEIWTNLLCARGCCFGLLLRLFIFLILLSLFLPPPQNKHTNFCFLVSERKKNSIICRLRSSNGYVTINVHTTRKYDWKITFLSQGFKWKQCIFIFILLSIRLKIVRYVIVHKQNVEISLEILLIGKNSPSYHNF